MSTRQTGRTTTGPVQPRARRAGSIIALLALVLAVGACDLDSPTAPDNTLTGTSDNQDFTFNGTITLSTSATTAPADDLSQVVVVAEVRNASGGPVQNLTPVTFSTDLGAFLVQDDQGNLVPVSVTQSPTFNGRASAVLASFNREFGTATITAGIHDVATSANVELEVVPVEGSVTLGFIAAAAATPGGPGGEGGDVVNVVNGAVAELLPFRSEMLATAVDTEGDPLAGVTIRFRIAEDDSTGSGRGPARFEGLPESFTNTAGEAPNQIIIVGAGRVVVEADVIDPNTGQVAATSNQAIAVTTEGVLAPAATLSIASAGTLSNSATAPYTELLLAEVSLNQLPLVGTRVRFVIRTDTTTGATLANTGTTLTNALGEATNAITVPSVGTVTIFAEILDASGAVVARTNDVVATGS